MHDYDPRRDGFRIDRVSLSGAVGAMMAIAGVLTLLQVPAVQWFLLTVAGGAVFGVALALGAPALR